MGGAKVRAKLDCIPKQIVLLWASTLCMVACQLCAQTIPDPSPSLQHQDRQRETIRQSNEPQPRATNGLAIATPEHQKIPVEQPCVFVHHIDIQGELFTPLLNQSLNGVNGDDPPLGRCLGGQGITFLIQRVQQSLIEQGYITSQVFVPEQDLNAGTLLIVVNEGRIDQIRNESSYKIPQLAWALKQGKILNLRDIEQSNDNLNRLSSIQSKIQIEPGNEPGTSDLVVDIQTGRPVKLGFYIDDAGLKTTGELQANATLSFDNPLGLSDFFYITKGQALGEKDPGPRDSLNQILHYSLALGYWFISTTWSDNRYHQTVYGPYQSYLYRGTSHQQELSIAKVLRRDARKKTTGSFKVLARQSNNFIDDLEVLVQRRKSAAWEAGLQHSQIFQKGHLTAQIAYRQGMSGLGSIAAPESATNQGTELMRLSTASVQWAMPFNLAEHAWQYTAQIQLQRALTRLTPQDRFCLGSRTTVHGFDEQQTVCGDEGQLLRQELATVLPEVLDWVDGLQIYTALDAGRVATPATDSSYRMSGVALGFRNQHKWSINFQLQWDVFWGKPLAYPDGFVTAKNTTGFNLRAEF